MRYVHTPIRVFTEGAPRQQLTEAVNQMLGRIGDALQLVGMRACVFQGFDEEFYYTIIDTDPQDSVSKVASPLTGNQIQAMKLMLERMVEEWKETGKEQPPTHGRRELVNVLKENQRQYVSVVLFGGMCPLPSHMVLERSRYECGKPMQPFSSPTLSCSLLFHSVLFSSLPLYSLFSSTLLTHSHFSFTPLTPSLSLSLSSLPLYSISLSLSLFSSTLLTPSLLFHPSRSLSCLPLSSLTHTHALSLYSTPSVL